VPPFGPRHARAGLDDLRSKAGSHLRLTDSCITQLKAQGPSRTCNESEEDEEECIPSRLAVAFS